MTVGVGAAAGDEQEARRRSGSINNSAAFTFSTLSPLYCFSLGIFFGYVVFISCKLGESSYRKRFLDALIYTTICQPMSSKYGGIVVDSIFEFSD
jgi:hypothetical protein